MKLFTLTILLAALVATNAFPTPQEQKAAETEESSAVVIFPVASKLTKDAAANDEVQMVQKIEIHVEVAAVPSGMMMPATVRVSEVRKKVPVVSEEKSGDVSALKYPEIIKVPAVVDEEATKPVLKTPIPEPEAVQEPAVVEAEKPEKFDDKALPEFIKVPPVEEESEQIPAVEVAADDKVEAVKNDEVVKSEETAEKPVADQAAEETESVAIKAEESVGVKTDVVKDDDSSSKSEEDVKVAEVAADPQSDEKAVVKVKVESESVEQEVEKADQEKPVEKEEVKIADDEKAADDVKIDDEKTTEVVEPAKKVSTETDKKEFVAEEKPAEIEQTEVAVADKEEEVKSEVIDPSEVQNVPIVEDISTHTKNIEAEPVYKVIPGDVEKVAEVNFEVVKESETKEKAVEEIKQEEPETKLTDKKEETVEVVQQDEPVKAAESDVEKSEEPAKKVEVVDAEITQPKVIVKPAKHQDDESIVFVVHAKRPENDESDAKNEETKVEDTPVEGSDAAAETEGSSIKAAAEAETPEKKAEDKSDSDSAAIKSTEEVKKVEDEPKAEEVTTAAPVKVEGKKGNKKKLPADFRGYRKRLQQEQHQKS